MTDWRPDWAQYEKSCNSYEDKWRYLIKKTPDSIRYIVDPSEELQLLAIDCATRFDIIKYIKNPTDKTQLAIIKKFPSDYRHIINYNPKIFDYAEYLYVKRFENPFNICEYDGTKHDLFLLSFIKHPHQYIQYHLFCITILSNPSKNLILQTYNLVPEIRNRFFRLDLQQYFDIQIKRLFNNNKRMTQKRKLEIIMEHFS